jgi:hypothetical protein
MNEHKLLLQIQNLIEVNTPDNFIPVREKVIALEADTNKNIRKNSFFTNRFRMAAAAFLFVLLAGSVTAAAYMLSGADFFERFFQERTYEGSDDEVYLGSDQFEEIASSTVGTVVDTDKLKIEVLGAIAGGNVSNIMLKVTANQVDNVSYVKDGDTPIQYIFQNNLGGSLGRNSILSNIIYLWPKDVKDLNPNQFELLYTIIGKEAFAGKQYTLELDDYGIFKRSQGFEKLYQDSWSFPINFDIKTDYSKAVNTNTTVTIDQYKFTVKRIDITPLALCFLFTGYAPEDETVTKALGSLQAGMDTVKAVFKNGKVLDSSSYQYSSVSSRVNPDGNSEKDTGYYYVILQFNKPVIIDNIKSVSIQKTKIKIP